MKNKISKILINPEDTIITALKRLSKSAQRCLIVVDNKKKFLGTISDGDIRRDILRNKDFSKKIKKVYNLNSVYIFRKDFNQASAEKILSNKKKKISILPILNNNLIPINYFTIYDLKSFNETDNYENPVLIMAGGEGKRLKPFTTILPKPLIPVRGKPVVIHIMNLFKSEGFKKFFISINHKDNLLKSYLSELRKIYNIKYIEEKNRLGSAGALRKINKIKKTFFVINCDSLLNINLKELLNFHKENKNDITLVASVKKFNIPYGVCEINTKKGNLVNMSEKPEQRIMANAGLYVCEEKIFQFLPKKIFFGMNELIDQLLKKRRKVGVFPIKDRDWKDTGNWMDYINAVQKNT